MGPRRTGRLGCVSHAVGTRSNQMKTLIALLVAGSLGAQTFQDRSKTVVAHYANIPDLSKGSYGNIAAKLARGQDMEWCSKQLEALLAQGPSGDMFWMFPVT